MPTPTGAVQSVRAASRQLVRELGFMNRHIADTDLTPSQVHALIEIDRQPRLQAAALKGLLLLDKSSISRLVADLVRRGYVRSARVEMDGRAKPLGLSRRGRAIVRRIHRTANRRVAAALEELTTAQKSTVTKGLEVYAEALRASRVGARSAHLSGVVIRSDYAPGVIGEVVALHARYYSRHRGFGAYFERLVAAELADFFAGFDARSDGFWTARKADAVQGSIAIEAARGKSRDARLRWFIVDDACQGMGLGGRLLTTALEHCDKRRFEKVYLTTIAGLDAARHLYEKHGFILEKESRTAHWGKEETEQLFVRRQ